MNKIIASIEAIMVFSRLPEKGARLTADSNLLWGQGNKRLMQYLKSKDIQTIKLAATTINEEELAYYGIHWMRIQDDEFIDPPAGYYVLDLLFYTREQKSKIPWFMDNKLQAKIGKTLFVYKF